MSDCCCPDINKNKYLNQILKKKNRFFWWFIREVAATEKKGEKKPQTNVMYAFLLHINSTLIR